MKIQQTKRRYADEGEFDLELVRIKFALIDSSLSNSDLEHIGVSQGLFFDEYDADDRTGFAHFIAEVALGGSWGGENCSHDYRQA